MDLGRYASLCLHLDLDTSSFSFVSLRFSYWEYDFWDHGHLDLHSYTGFYGLDHSEYDLWDCLALLRPLFRAF